jgi:hypothetical protein
MSEENEIINTDDENEDIRTEIGDALTQADTEQETGPEAEVVQEEEYNAKFGGYKPEDVEVLKTLPVDVQKLIDAREDRFLKGIAGNKELKSFVSGIEKTLAPDREFLESNNIEPDKWVNSLINGERQLRSPDPMTRVQALHAIAKNYGIPLDVLNQVPFDERSHKLQLERDQYKAQIEAQGMTEQEAQEESILSYIEEFRQKNEYFDELSDEITALLQAGIAKGNTPEERLQAAYDKAIRINDDIHSKIQSKQTDLQNKLNADKAAKAAKAANVSVKGSPTGSLKRQAPQTTEEATAAAFEALGL